MRPCCSCCSRSSSSACSEATPRSCAGLGPSAASRASGLEIRTSDSVPERGDAPPATDVSGVTLNGDAVQIGLGPGGRLRRLLAFLSSGCAVCEGFWRDFQAYAKAGRSPSGARTCDRRQGLKPRAPGAPARARPRRCDARHVIGSVGGLRRPYHPLLRLRRRRLAAGSTARARPPAGSRSPRFSPTPLTTSRSLEPSRPRPPRGPRPLGGAERALRAERELQGPVIGPGHPSLYPTDGQAEEARSSVLGAHRLWPRLAIIGAIRSALVSLR